MLNITNHQGNANQNYNAILPQTDYDGTIKGKKERKKGRKEENNCWQGCGEIRTLVHC